MTDAGDQAAGARGVKAALLWAAFLGSSWTWVVGMLFPALLLRDYGIAGWFVFAIPNVLGAAALAFVLPSPRASRRVVEAHLPVALRFSDVTIAFQVFAVGWIGTRMFGIDAALAAAGVAIVVFAVCFQSRKMMLAVAAAITLISLALFARFGALPGSWGMLVHGVAAPKLTRTDLALFAPASVLGFALCPYLDLTFHRARQATDGATGRLAFVIGFGIFFLAMIVFSLLYAPLIIPAFGAGTMAKLPDIAAWLIAAQLIVQAGLTVGLHLHEVASRRGHEGLHRSAAFVIAGGALAYWALAAKQPTTFGISIGEAVYRSFLLFYGLVFPAYVFLVMIPTPGLRRMQPRLITWLITCLVAAPFAFYFIVARQSLLILPVLGLLLLARLVLHGWPGRKDEGDRRQEPGSHGPS